MPNIINAADVFDISLWDKIKGGAESLSVDWSISIDHPQPTYALLPIIIRQK